MSQLLAFALRRRKLSEDHCPEGIHSQNSSDTATTIPEWNENYICIPRRKGVTVTPEGLLPRKPLTQLRSELMITEDDLLLNTKSTIDCQTKQQSRDVSNQESSPQTRLVVSTMQKLPPQPSRSWSTRSSSYPWGSSPRSPTTLTTTWTAESPNLVPGHARTAVGNLVALQQQKDPPGLTPMHEKKLQWSPESTYSPQEQETTAGQMFSPLTKKASSDPSSSRGRKSGSTTVIFSPVISEKSSNKAVAPRRSKGSSKSIICKTSSSSLSDPSLNAHAVWPQISVHPSLDHDMKRIKAKNQHQAKEELCLQILERLQDNIELVTKVDSMFPWFGSNNTGDSQQGGLITGFSEEKRYDISDKLDLLLNELNNGVQTEEFFFSPGKANMSDYDDGATHRELRKAVAFCKVMVQMAIPEEENESASLQGTNEIGRWRFLFSEEIGLDIPQTPFKGSNSFFSLPESEAATPMTSNLSLGASTLTTRPQTIAEIPGIPHNGLDLRHALQSYISALQKMAYACTNFSEMGSLSAAGLVRTAEKIKQTYHTLMDINTVDLRFMVDAFDFVIDESTEIESPVMRAETLGSGMIANVSMHTDASSYEMDDLRREVGSIDYSDQDDDPNNASLDFKSEGESEV